MARGYSSGRLTDLYREAYTDNSDQPAFAKYSDVHREAQPALTSSNNTNDSWLTRVRHFLKGLI